MRKTAWPRRQALGKYWRRSVLFLTAVRTPGVFRGN